MPRVCYSGVCLCPVEHLSTDSIFNKMILMHNEFTVTWLEDRLTTISEDVGLFDVYCVGSMDFSKTSFSYDHPTQFEFLSLWRIPGTDTLVMDMVGLDEVSSNQKQYLRLWVERRNVTNNIVKVGMVLCHFRHRNLFPNIRHIVTFDQVFGEKVG